MAKIYRGDNLPVVASYEGYTFKPGDVVTAGILRQNGEDYEVLAEVTVEVRSQSDEVQLEFSREKMYDVAGDLVLEVRTVTASDVEMTIQKNLTIERDGLR